MHTACVIRETSWKHDGRSQTGASCINTMQWRERCLAGDRVGGEKGGALRPNPADETDHFVIWKLAASKECSFPLTAWASVLKQWAITVSLSCLPSGTSIHSSVGARYGSPGDSGGAGLRRARLGRAGPGWACSQRQHDTLLIRGGAAVAAAAAA